ncbi:hypothetical protein [Streptomyces sp. NBC_01285]|uniref:hypothetical protein n=1 Tax=Streptomyces sp. NBC_01285 TaxID=2903813 RepID=UPI0022573E38|nr:hypothetical protein [Streptomyces sp. NBC_01285]MCX4768722.1 hypothetical protein [Streptomyces sp. NBC_01285]
MTVHQHAVSISEFARYLRHLTQLLDPARGWYGVFCRRDPEGMRACLEGAEIPPWDVMESLFSDLATVRGAGFAELESVRAAELYAAAAAAHDRRPGGRQQLVERLELMLREQAHAARRLRTAHAGGEAGAVDAESAAWARDDHERASARCTELRRRLSAVAVPAGWFREEADSVAGAADNESGAERETVPEVEAAGPAPAAPAPRRTPPSVPTPPVRRRPRGARFAGLDVDDESPVSVAPVLPVPPVAAAVPRGARFGGAPGADEDPAARVAAALDPAALKSARDTVAALLRLRTDGRSGEAHGVLCEAAGQPADRLPVLAAELQRAGLDADWATLLWEVSSLSPAALAAAAAALAEAGRPEDCGRLLRQGVARPAAEIADAVAALDRAGRGSQAQALLGAFVRVRTPQDAARIAERDPRHLVPQLLAAARGVSEARERDVVHALRVAGIG